MLLTAQAYLDKAATGEDPFRTSIEARTDRCGSDECGVVLQEAITGYREFGGKPHCSDDYYDKLGELVEKHPLGRPIARVGRT